MVEIMEKLISPSIEMLFVNSKYLFKFRLADFNTKDSEFEQITIIAQIIINKIYYRRQFETFP